MRRSDRCPDLGELLLASEGELAVHRSVTITSHLRRCPACRERLRDVSRTVHEVRDAEDVLTPEALSRDWSRFHPRLLAAERAHARASLRLPSHRWLVVAATLTVVVLAFLASDRYAAVVTAEELLSRAVSHERAQPAMMRQRVRIRLTPPARSRSRSNPESRLANPERRLAAREAPPWPALGESEISMVTEAGPGGAAASIASDLRLGQVASLLEQRQFRWNGVPSAAAFHAWRSTLRDRTDSVFRPSIQLLGLRTRTTDGWLRQVVLVVREGDYHPVRQVLTFADHWELSVEEIASWLPAEPRARVAAASATLPKPAVPARIVDRLADLELDVRETLHDLEADWRDGLVVRRAASRLMLEGRVPTQARRDELKLALAFPELVVDVTVDPGGAGAATLSAPSPGLNSRLARVFPNPRVRESYVPRAVTLVAELEARSRAFETLAREYPSRRVSRLSEAAREKLRGLAARHHRDLIAHLEELDRHLAPVLGTATRLSPPALSDDWRSMPASLASAARLTRHRLASWVSSQTSDPDRVIDAGLQEALDSCWALVDSRSSPTSPVLF